MGEFIPYFAALIMVMFGIAFYAALQGFKNLDEDPPAPVDTAK
jgi:hypothetical protein